MAVAGSRHPGSRWMPCGPPVRSLPPPGGAAGGGGSPRLGGAIMCPPGSGAGLLGVGAAAAVGAGLGVFPRCPWVPVPRGRAFGAPMVLTARVWRAAGLSPSRCGPWWRGLRGCSAKGGPEAASGPMGGGGRLHPPALPGACRASSTSPESLAPQSQPRPGHRSKERGARLAGPASGELWSSREGGLWKAKKRLERKPLVIARTKGSEILFGISPCSLALSQPRRDLFRLFLKQSSGSRWFVMSEFVLQATARGVPVHYVNRKQLDDLCRGQVHQGVCLEATPLRFKSLEEAETPDLRDEEGPNRQLIWLVLEQIQDPMNLGALLRSAYFLGVDRVVTSQRNRYGAGCLLLQLFSVFSCWLPKRFPARQLLKGLSRTELELNLGSCCFVLQSAGRLWDVVFQAGKEPPWAPFIVTHFVFQLCIGA